MRGEGGGVEVDQGEWRSAHCGPPRGPLDGVAEEEAWCVEGLDGPAVPWRTVMWTAPAGALPATCIPAFHAWDWVKLLCGSVECDDTEGGGGWDIGCWTPSGCM